MSDPIEARLAVLESERQEFAGRKAIRETMYRYCQALDRPVT